MVNNIEKIYYESQIEWSSDDYFYLHRQLHRMLSYYDKYIDEIKNMDINRMTDETKVLMYCIIKYYHYEFMFDEYENLSELKDVKPLKNTLVLDSNTLPEDNIYKFMNVAY